MYHGVKRIVDVVLSGLALLVLAPLLIPVGIGLLLTGEHYVFLFAAADRTAQPEIRHLEICDDAEEQSESGRGLAYHPA